MWGSGRGVEDINSGNVGYYNGGMYAAKNRDSDDRFQEDGFESGTPRSESICDKTRQF